MCLVNRLVTVAHRLRKKPRWFFRGLDFFRNLPKSKHARFIDRCWSGFDKCGAVGMLRSRRIDLCYFYRTWMLFGPPKGGVLGKGRK